MLHETHNPFAAHMDAFIAQLLMNAWTAVAPLMLKIDFHDLFGDFAIFSLPLRGRALHPGVEPADRNREHYT
ncbi:hypothetical protein KSC_033070 [Ktedonobacter sp. SOSP1-52]|nr:hypothetical protein KSC_033070 [Ktedonobacter sp. SOSP1-52]